MTAAGRPACYRHPGRVAAVRCQRCERPICPDDMVEASVGYQCPDCVSAGRKTVRVPRTFGGGAIVAKPGIITQGFIGLIVAVFVLTSLFSDLSGELGMWSPGVVIGDQYYRFITANVVHSGIGHLLFNSIALWIFGTYVEAALGRWRYVATILVTALGASTAVFWWSDLRTLTVGASGIVFGLFAIAFIMMLRQRENVSGMVILLAINALYSFRGGISWQGHLGGFILGVVLGLLFTYGPRVSRDRWHIVGIVGMVVVLAVAVLVRSVELDHQLGNAVLGWVAVANP